MDLRSEHFKDWLPIRFFQDGDRGSVDLIYLGNDRFTAPFFNDTIEVRLRDPFSLLFMCNKSLDFLGEIHAELETTPPRGFIFHVSRCGSTLVSQMLASLDKNIVISEAPVLDSILRSRVSDEQKMRWLQWVVGALGRKRFVQEESLFIKFDSWSVLDLPLIERTFPDVPWIFVYRDPVEVVVSNMRMPGVQMIPGAIEKIFPQMDLAEILEFSTEERFARTIAAFCQAALESAGSPRRKFINYLELPYAVTGDIAEHFGLELSEGDIEKMVSSSRFHAKTPAKKFVSDTREKRDEASADVIHFTGQLVTPLYERLQRCG